MRKKLTRITALIFIAALLTLTLGACNKDKKALLTDIYEHSAGFSEFTSYRQEIELPQGWSVYVDLHSGKNPSDTGYIKSMDAFVITNGSVLSVIKCGAKEMMFPESMAISALRVKGNLIALKSLDGSVGVYSNSDGKIVLSMGTGEGVSETTSIDLAIKILDDGLIAVNQSYDVNDSKGYTSIYRPTTTGDITERGELVCRVKNPGGALAKVSGFDSKFVAVLDVTEGGKQVNRLFNIPLRASASAEKLNLDGTANGRFTQNDGDGYFIEITYIGRGRFLVHEDWLVKSTDNYTYYDGEDYVEVSRHIYYPESDRLESFTSDFVFLNLTNRYYDADKGGIDVKGFLKGEYMYASFGLFFDGNKRAYYDQFILDADLNIALSVTGNFGVDIKKQDIDEINIFDLVLDFVDGYGYSPVLPSSMKVFDKNGNVVFNNTQYKVASATMNDGMIVAKVVNPEDEDGFLYGAFDLHGNVAVPFIYSNLNNFRGYYTLGTRKIDGKTTNVIVGKNGVEVETLSDGSAPLGDVATTASGSIIQKTGCFMYARTVDGNTLYGIKTFNANASKNVIMEAKMEKGSVLYAPSSSPENVFVFEKITVNNAVSYTVYRLV